MKFEGAEQAVMEDLIESGVAVHIDGYYGMWDDLSKIDPAADRSLRRLLQRHHITVTTFNDRDLPFRLRREAILIDLLGTIRDSCTATQPAQ